jgi:hypothetical protein
MINIEVFDNGGATADRYTVLIGEDAYLMSTDAHMPNGVCMYAGRNLVGDESERIQLSDLPRGTLIQIERTLKWERDYLVAEYSDAMGMVSGALKARETSRE